MLTTVKFGWVWMVACFTMGALTLAGCGESKQDVIARYQQPAEQMRAKLKLVADKLPPTGSLPAVSRAEVSRAEVFDPPLSYDGSGKEGNTEVVMEVQLRDPEAKPDFDLQLSPNLLRCLAWTGRNSPLTESARKSAAGTIEHEFQQALYWKYLVVARVVSYVPPQLVGEAQFVGGEVDLEIYVVRASDGELVGAFPIQARPADSVGYSYKPTDSRAERASAFVHSSVWEDARQKLASGLREISPTAAWREL